MIPSERTISFPATEAGPVLEIRDHCSGHAILDLPRAIAELRPLILVNPPGHGLQPPQEQYEKKKKSSELRFVCEGRIDMPIAFRFLASEGGATARDPPSRMAERQGKSLIWLTC